MEKQTRQMDRLIDNKLVKNFSNHNALDAELTSLRSKVNYLQKQIDSEQDRLEKLGKKQAAANKLAMEVTRKEAQIVKKAKLTHAIDFEDPETIKQQMQ